MLASIGDHPHINLHWSNYICSSEQLSLKSLVVNERREKQGFSDILGCEKNEDVCAGGKHRW